MSSVRTADEAARQEVAANPVWYHTMELAPGLVTPGWFDLRPIIERLPWPDLVGKRCLDVGPYDGYLGFEMERRGAAEVVAADVAESTDWDWPLRLRESGPRGLAARGITDPGRGFAIAKRLLGSDVERVKISAYDLDPAELDRFDFVSCGSLLLHLRDPVRALEAIRSVCGGSLLSCEQISAELTIRRRSAAADFRFGEVCQWWIPNPAGHRALLYAAGFTVERSTRPYAIPLGPGHPAVGRLGERKLRERLLGRMLTRGTGVPHVASLATPQPIGKR